MPRGHRELHRTQRIGWLRAAVLGANDGIVSTASLVVGVAAAEATRHDILVSGVAGLVAGALSMASGEYVSVSSQTDTERAELRTEREELATQPKTEEDELAQIYVRRGLNPNLARVVARDLMRHARWPRMPVTSSACRRNSRHARCRRRWRRRQRLPLGRECQFSQLLSRR